MEESLNDSVDGVDSLMVSMSTANDAFLLQFIGIIAHCAMAVLPFFVLESFSIRLSLTRSHDRRGAPAYD
jgi:hypothetical protein